jgi:hypothetical protein
MFKSDHKHSSDGGKSVFNGFKIPDRRCNSGRKIDGLTDRRLNDFGGLLLYNMFAEPVFS